LRFPKGVARRSARLAFAAWLVARRVTVTCKKEVKTRNCREQPKVGCRTTVYAKYPKKAPKAP
jgi:hypothetical protein